MGLLGKIWVKLGLDNSEFKQGLNDSEKASNKFKDFIKGIGQGIIAAFSIQAIIGFTKEVYKLASAAQGVEMAFKNIAPKGLLADLRRATMNSVDDMQLMQRAVQANNFKIPLEQLATYLQFATKRAIETGQSVDYLVDSIITGLGRESVMILDNLGLSSAEIRTQMEGGASMAEAVSEIINRDMAKGAGVIETAATNSAQLTAAWTNFKTQLGESILGIGRFEKALADTLRYLSSSGGGVTMLDLFRSLVDPSHLKKLSEQSDAYSKMQQEANAYATEQMKAITSIASAEKRLVEIQNLKTAKYDALRLKLREYIAANKELVKVETEATAVEEKGKEGSIKALQELLDLKKKDIDLTTDESKRAALNQELANLEHRLAVMKLTTDELKAYNDLIARGKSALPSVNNNIQGRAVVQNQKDPIKGVTNGIQSTTQQLGEFNDKLDEEVLRSADIAANFGRTVAQSISDSFQIMFDAIASGEKIDASTMVKAILTPFADMAVQMGEVMIATGVAAEAAKLIGKTGGGWGAIAAGVALVAIGTAAKSAIGAIGANFGKSGGSGGSSYGTTGGGMGSPSWQPTSSMNMNINLTGVLKGQDLYLAIEKTKANKNR